MYKKQKETKMNRVRTGSQNKEYHCTVIAYTTISTYKHMHSSYDRYNSTEVTKMLII